MKDQVYIDKKYATSTDLTKELMSDGTFGKLRLYLSHGFNLTKKKDTNCFTLQIRTMGKVTRYSNIERKVTSNVEVSINDLETMLAYAKDKLEQCEADRA